MDFHFPCILECLTHALGLNSTLVMQLTRVLPFGFAVTCAALAAPAPQPTALAVLPRINSNEYFNYTTLTGFFLQDDPATSTTGFDYVSILSNGSRKDLREDDN
jgi:hypothetical protein